MHNRTHVDEQFHSHFSYTRERNFAVTSIEVSALHFTARTPCYCCSTTCSALLFSAIVHVLYLHFCQLFPCGCTSFVSRFFVHVHFKLLWIALRIWPFPWTLRLRCVCRIMMGKSLQSCSSWCDLLNMMFGICDPF